MALLFTTYIYAVASKTFSTAVSQPHNKKILLCSQLYSQLKTNQLKLP